MIIAALYPCKMNFEESKSRIKKILLQDRQDEAFQNWFSKLKQNADIDVEYDVLQRIS